MKLSEVPTEQLKDEITRRERAEREEFERTHRRVSVACPKCKGRGNINYTLGPCPDCIDGVMLEWVHISDPRAAEILEKERLDIEDEALAAIVGIEK